MLIFLFQITSQYLRLFILIIISPGGSAAHAHISVHTPGRTPDASSTHANLNKVEASFLAGVLEHLSALTLLFLPLAFVLQTHGGWYLVWRDLCFLGELNTKIRLCDCAILILLQSRNFELKNIRWDSKSLSRASWSTYMAGLTGIVELKELTIDDCSGGSFPCAIG